MAEERKQQGYVSEADWDDFKATVSAGLTAREQKKRGKADKAQVGLRLPEPLRARLEAEAKEWGYSLNNEIVRRLGLSLQDDDLGKLVFGDGDIFHCAYVFAGIIQALERHTGKRVREDSSIFEMAADQLPDFAGIVPNAGLMGISRGLAGTRAIFDVAAARALQARALQQSSEEAPGDA